MGDGHLRDTQKLGSLDTTQIVTKMDNPKKSKKYWVMVIWDEKHGKITKMCRSKPDR